MCGPQVSLAHQHRHKHKADQETHFLCSETPSSSHSYSPCVTQLLDSSHNSLQCSPISPLLHNDSHTHALTRTRTHLCAHPQPKTASTRTSTHSRTHTPTHAHLTCGALAAELVDGVHAHLVGGAVVPDAVVDVRLALGPGEPARTRARVCARRRRGRARASIIARRERACVVFLSERAKKFPVSSTSPGK